jgi:hypothetical protein
MNAKQSDYADYVLDAMTVMDSCGLVTRGEYVGLLEDMEDKYPGVGWREAANNLEDWYLKWGLSLSEKPARVTFDDVHWGINLRRYGR